MKPVTRDGNYFFRRVRQFGTCEIIENNFGCILLRGKLTRRTCVKLESMGVTSNQQLWVKQRVPKKVYTFTQISLKMCIHFWHPLYMTCVLIIKPTRCTKFSNLFLEQNSTCFGQVFCPLSGVQHCTHSNRYMSYRLC